MRYRGESFPPNLDKNSSTFEQIAEFTEKSWLNSVKSLDQGLGDWQQAIEDSSEDKLDEGIPGFPEDDIWWESISTLCLHNSYHIGQIIYIRKEQGSWNE